MDSRDTWSTKGLSGVPIRKGLNDYIHIEHGIVNTIEPETVTEVSRDVEP